MHTFQRILLRYSDSHPFLSGDAFARIADIAIYSPQIMIGKPSRRKVANAKVIFCPGDKFERFIDEYSGSINAKVLILGNSDRDYLEIPERIPNSVNQLFIQNCQFIDEKVTPLPIGVENLRHAKNGVKSLFSDRFIEKEKLPRMLIGPFRPTHPEREILNLVPSSSLSLYTHQRDILTPREYAELSSRFALIASPRGNGIDTHRFWETLYRGSYPVVLKSKWSSNFRAMGFPLIEISSWSQDEINSMVSQFKWQRFKPNSLPQLWLPYWRNRINQFL